MAMQEYRIWNDLKSSSKPLPEMRKTVVKNHYWSRVVIFILVKGNAMSGSQWLGLNFLG